MRKSIWRNAIFSFLLGGTLSGADFAPEEFERISGPASPLIELALRKNGAQVLVGVRTVPMDGATPRVLIGIAASKDARVTPAPQTVDNRVLAVAAVPLAEFFANDSDWRALRIAVSVAWPGGALGKERWRERCLHVSGAPHGELSKNSSDWLPFDLDAYQQRVADRRNRIAIPLDQPFDGKATVVIESENGQRLRNLVSGRDFASGKHNVVWDGLDEDGRPVPPGAYCWRAISHPGVWPEYLFSFCNDGAPPWRNGSGTDMWGPDHSMFSTACVGTDWTFFAGSCAESGYAMAAVDAQGIKRKHYNAVMGTGIEKVFLACDDKYLYAAHDGFAWDQKVDRTKPDWKAPRKVTLTRFDIKGGNVVDYPGKGRFAVLMEPEAGPGSALKDWRTHTLQGLALLNGKLYLSDYHGNRIVRMDPATAALEGEIRVEAPGPLVAGKDALFAILQKKNIARIDVVKNAAQPLPIEGVLQPAGIAIDAEGRLYLSDRATHTVKAFSAAGKQWKEFGKPGGAYAGPYDAQRMIEPGALAIAPNGWLWVTEKRGAPKRVVAWDVNSGAVVKEKFGPTAYGASSAGFDNKDHTRWVGQGALWSLDFASKSGKPVALLRKEGGNEASEHDVDLPKHVTFHHQDGRIFLIGMGNVTSVGELKADGSMRPLACVGSTHRFAFANGWHPPEPAVEAFEKAYPAKKGKFADKGPAFLWLDRNGDGDMQANEFDFSTEASDFAGGYWGHDALNLSLRFPATYKNKRVLVTLKPDGFLPTGSPKYPTLNEALATAVTVELDHNQIETSTDRQGRTIVNSDPRMKAFDAQGKLAWTFPNRWSNVHGSHNAPLPEPGVMQGSLFFLGMAPLDDASDVFVLNGNHGRFFILTSDGFYLDEMFKDVRMGGTLDAYLIGGECFGGFFGRSDKDGNYYLQSGHTDYRIFRLHGLDKVKRSAGTLNVTPDQVTAVERAVALRVAAKSEKREASARWFDAPPKIDAKDDDWGKALPINWEKSGKFPVKARIGYDAANLYLHYTVEDNSPWLNTGKDNTLLFKTGDSIDLQLGTDPSANPKRTQPVPGDLRLLIGDSNGQPTAVLYRHRIKGAKENPVTFTSPWRSEVVDAVKVLDTAKAVVVKERNLYRVEAAIPLAALGLESPGGKTLRADFGALYGDDAGTITMLRSYWSNQATNLVNDVPGEIMLTPNLWGTLYFEASTK